MYNLYPSELKSKYRYQLVNMAVTWWKSQSLDNDIVSDKITELETRIDRATKKEFIKMFQEYSRRIL